MPDTSVSKSSECANFAIHGIVSVEDANYANPPGNYAVEVDLGISFNSEPVIQLTQKLFHDEDGNVYDSGDHEFTYRWIDANNFNRFEIMLKSSRVNYPPSISYLVTARLNVFQRILYCIFH